MVAYENLDVVRLCPTDPVRQRHLQRYHFAAQWATGSVLDAGCGYGLGTWTMAQHGALHVLGVDRDEAAIAIAQQWARPTEPGRVRYMRVPDLEDPDCLDGMLFDTLVAIEFLEHLKDPNAFVQYWQKRVWRIVFTVPGIPSKDSNPYHLHDLHNDWIESHFLQSPISWKCLSREILRGGTPTRDLSLCYAWDKVV